MNRIVFITLLLMVFAVASQAQNGEEIKWYSFEEAVQKNKENPKMIFVDLYTNWCGWCKVMDNKTFSDPVIAKYMNENFYPVKFNAEGSDTVEFAGRTYVNPRPGVTKSTHQLAIAMLQGKLSYPSYALMNKNNQMVQVLNGYIKKEQFEPIIHFFGSGAYKNMKWPEFQQGFEGKLSGTSGD